MTDDIKLEERKINGDKVAMLRERRGWSQRELADLVGLSQAGVNTVEKSYRNQDTGVLRSTSVEKFIRLAEVFNVSLDYLADRTDDPSAPAQLAQKLEVVADTPEQKSTLRIVLDYARKLSADELHMVTILLKRLSETEHVPHTAEATEAALAIDLLPPAERVAALAAVRAVETKINHVAAAMEERMKYLIELVESGFGVDERAEIERQFNVRFDDGARK